jgi:hypothetical protein
MIEETNEQVERENIQGLALRYIHRKKTNLEIRQILKKAGVTTKHHLQAYGLKSERYSDFVNELARLDYFDWKEVANELGVSSTVGEVRRDKRTFSLDKTLDTGDRVLIAPYKFFERTDQGQFLTGFNKSEGRFTFSTEPTYDGHSQLKGRTLREENILEGGFMRVYPIQKSIELYGLSDTFRVYPGDISLNLLKRALPDWVIRSE